MAKRYDAIIIGGGHNGLTAAAYLARAGRSVAGPVTFDLVGPSGDRWLFTADDDDAAAVTTVRGPALDLCRVAGQRASAASTSLTAVGPDAEDVLELVRTFA